MFVVDASALAKAFLEEGKSKEFRAWIGEVLADGRLVQAPALAHSEIGRTIQKEIADLPSADAKELHRAAFIGITLLPLPADRVAVWDCADGVSYYDAEYLHAAKGLGATLVSADERQMHAARRLGIPVLSFSPGGDQRSKIEALDALADHRRKLKPAKTPSEQVLREARDD